MRHFLTFGSAGWEYARERAGALAQATGEFDRVHIRTEADLAEWPKLNWARWTRGFGFWTWKVWLALRVWGEMADGDVLMYSDAGNLLRPSNDWARYFGHAVQYGGCFFFHGHRERTWTKGDVLQRFPADTIDSRGQAWAGAWFLRHSEQNNGLLWRVNKFASEAHNVDDSPSETPNDPAFREHRHDQSVFSLYVKDRCDARGFLSSDQELGMHRAIFDARVR